MAFLRVTLRASFCGVAAAVSCACALAEPAPSDDGASAAFHTLGKLRDRRLREVSGIAQSPTRDDRLWVINDSGNGPRLHLLDLSGKHQGAIVVAGAANTDWEDLAAFTWNGAAHLLIADVGDNAGRRKYVSVYAVAEPDMEDIPASVAPVWELRFRYPDGPRDVEALAVDARDQQILVLSKRDFPAVLYSVALPGPGATPRESVLTATRLGPIGTIPAPGRADLLDNPVFGMFSSQPTAMDVGADGSIAVLTYLRAYLFPRAGHRSVMQALMQPPQHLSMPKFRVAEAMTFLRGGGLAVTGEGLPVNLVRLHLGAKTLTIPPAP